MGILTNQGNGSVQDVTLRVSLADAHGNILERSNTALAVPLLGPNASAPFSAEFRTTAGDQVKVEVTGYSPAPKPPLPINITLIRRGRTGDGQLAVVGSMANPNAQAVQVAGLALVATDAEGELVNMSTSWRGLTGLAPGQSAPFLALLPPSDDTAHLQSFTAGLASQALSVPPVDLAIPPVLKTDDQGNLIALGAIHNHTGSPALGRVVVSLIGTGGPASVSLYASPIPLAPDEDRPFALTDFPGLLAQLASGAQNSGRPAAGSSGGYGRFSPRGPDTDSSGDRDHGL